MTDNQPTPKISDSDKTAIKYIALAGGAFVFVCALLFAAGTWITPAGVDGYSPSKGATADSDGSFTITVNSSNRTKWVPVNLGAGRVAAKGEKPDLLSDSDTQSKGSGKLTDQEQDQLEKTCTKLTKMLKDLVHKSTHRAPTHSK